MDRPRVSGPDLRRSSVSASTADAIIRNRLTAFSTGVAPSRIRPYIITVSGESAPTSIKVVLKSANDIRNEIAAEPSRAGRRYGRTMVRNTAALEAPEVQRRFLESAIEAPQAGADGERGDGGDVGELTEHHQRQPGPQEIQLQAEGIVGEFRDAAREGENRYAQNDAGYDQRRQHQDGEGPACRGSGRAR